MKTKKTGVTFKVIEGKRPTRTVDAGTAETIDHTVTLYEGKTAIGPAVRSDLRWTTA